MKSKRVQYLSFCVILLLACSAFAQSWTPPPLPDVPPLISETYSDDADGNRIDDSLELSISSHRSTRLFSVHELEDQQKLPLDVELIFNAPITQHQINEFLRLGGEITFIYRALSYGWSGRIPLDQVSLLPSVLGSSLVLISEPKAAGPNMDIATKTGRVRPIWKPDFAGSLHGFDGDEDMTIGIIDSGIDANHLDFEAEYVFNLNDIEPNSPQVSDLSGRCLYWMDFSKDKYVNPVDFTHHGSSVASVTWGTGISQEMDARFNGGLFWTDYSEPNAWVCGGSPVSLPGGEIEVALRSKVYFEETQSNFAFAYRQYPSAGITVTWPIRDEFPSGTTIGPSPLMVDGSCSAFVQGAKNAVITSSLSPYPASNDGFNSLRGVAPGCRLALVKTTAGDDPNLYGMGDALKLLADKRKALNLRVVNLSFHILGDGIDEELRQDVYNAVGYGVVVVASAGNDGNEPEPDIDDPGRAAFALTVGASNDENQLTNYSSWGFLDPNFTKIEFQEDYKPDLIAPGGSSYHSGIMSVDSGSSDGLFWEDQQQWDYRSVQGTSFSAPFVAGCAALVIDAMEKADPNLVWDYTSSRHALFVKMILCATATETGEDRENGRFNPTLQRAENGPDGFPPGKDRYEGYGIVNPDAAIEAVYMMYEWDAIASGSLGSGPTDKRAWARRVSLSPGRTYSLTLDNPEDGDFDLYLYSGEPSSTGTPRILAYSTNPDQDVDELLSYTATEADSKAVLVVKRVSGDGEFWLNNPFSDEAQVTFDKADVESNPDLQTVPAVYEYGTDYDQAQISLYIAANETLSWIERGFEYIGGILVQQYERTVLSLEKDGEDVTYTFRGALGYLDIDADRSGPNANNQYDIFWETYTEPGREENTLKRLVDNKGPLGSEPDGVADEYRLVFSKGHAYDDFLISIGRTFKGLSWVDLDYDGSDLATYVPSYDKTYWSRRGEHPATGEMSDATYVYNGTLSPESIIKDVSDPTDDIQPSDIIWAPLPDLPGYFGMDGNNITYTYSPAGEPNTVIVEHYPAEGNLTVGGAIDTSIEQLRKTTAKVKMERSIYASDNHSVENVTEYFIADYDEDTTLIDRWDVTGGTPLVVSSESYSHAILTFGGDYSGTRANERNLVEAYRVLDRTGTTITEMWVHPDRDVATTITVTDVISGDVLTTNEYWMPLVGSDAAEMTLDEIITEIGWTGEVCGNPDWCE